MRESFLCEPQQKLLGGFLIIGFTFHAGSNVIRATVYDPFENEPRQPVPTSGSLRIIGVAP